LPRTFNAFHWHGETFQLPNGAVHLARVEAGVAGNHLPSGAGRGIAFEHAPNVFADPVQHGLRVAQENNNLQSPTDLVNYYA
jgi:hypothetical protein